MLDFLLATPALLLLLFSLLSLSPHLLIAALIRLLLTALLDFLLAAPALFLLLPLHVLLLALLRLLLPATFRLLLPFSLLSLPPHLLIAALIRLLLTALLDFARGHAIFPSDLAAIRTAPPQLAVILFPRRTNTPLVVLPGRPHFALVAIIRPARAAAVFFP